MQQHATQKYTEAELVTLLQQRSQSAFSYLYDNYAGAIYAVVCSIITDNTLASDVLQEVFVKIWRQIATYDSTKGRLYTWMLNIARNASIDTLRSKGFQNSQQNREWNEAVYEDISSTQVNAEVIGLRKLVHTLKPELKTVVELAYFHGYTQEDIAAMLEIPLGTVKTRLRTALIKLRTIIKP
ncbi:MAG TPA: RNA polymerase subunit sigma-70 [Chitinophagaceae bacterium]|nr:RNA polymerase subunit sigma-70 [Chitinophagaceae bacterium]HAN38078.1 RNA polymerase subunit sigma-70 [Chitinophagaceae bacterium]